MRARFALLASGWRCELREVVLRDKPAALLAASPKGTVPVLVDGDGVVIDQSLDIMRTALQRHDPAQWLSPAHGGLDGMLALITECDTDFKQQLDRYKYPNRFEGADSAAHRLHGARFLQDLEGRLAAATNLFGDRPALADMAISPFVRQFAQTDPGWFALQPWPGLHRWLAALTASPLWNAAMHKYPAWRPGDAPLWFPADR
ncbi:MAG: glutathione S-transferase [Comamonadaceae bacterium]|nr:MAG: glutathione S-transferase [Comamonadaceae bacterium]